MAFTNSILADESFCKGKLDGSYEDPRNCAAYYQCFRFSTIRRRCPRGQVFNGFVKACDSRENFPCRQRTFVSVPSPSRERVTSKVVISQTQHRLETNDDSSSTTKGMSTLVVGLGGMKFYHQLRQVIMAPSIPCPSMTGGEFVNFEFT